MPIDVWRGHDFDIGQPGDASNPTKSLGGETPVDELVAVVDVSGLVDLDSRGVARQTRTVGLDDQLPGRRQDVGQRPQQRDRVGHPMQDPEAQDQVEAFPQAPDVERVHPLVVNVRAEDAGNRVEAGTAGQGNVEPALTQSTYCSLSTATTRRAPRRSARKL